MDLKVGGCLGCLPVSTLPHMLGGLFFCRDTPLHLGQEWQGSSSPNVRLGKETDYKIS